MKDLELKGIWWLPDSEENAISGILNFNSEDGAYLELMGQLSAYEMLETTIILGKTANGDDITLYKCFEVKKNYSSNTFPTTLVFANIIFRGVHFNAEEDIRFNELSCHYSNLDEWAWINRINIDQSIPNKIEISYEYPGTISVDIGENYTVEIYAITKTSTYSIVQKEASIVQRVYFKLINNKLNSFEQHRSKLSHIQNLISLGVGAPVGIMDFIGKTEENKEEYEGDVIYPKVTIYFSTNRASNDYKEILPPHMLFSLRDIKEDFDNIIKKWFDSGETLKPVFNLYFGTIYNSDMYLEQRFLSLIQAIESYHRRTRTNNEMDPEEHEKMVDNIIGSVDDQYKEWIESRLTYSNEPTLRSRLRELIKECNLLLKLSSSRKQKSFISKVCDTRNYLTHYDVSLSDLALKGGELWNACIKLNIIIEFNLLLELGFNNRKSYELLEKKYKRYNIF